MGFDPGERPEPPTRPSSGAPGGIIYNYIWGSNVPKELDSQADGLSTAEAERRFALQEKWWNTFRLVKGNKNSIQAIAKDAKVDGAVLASVVFAFYGVQSPTKSFVMIRRLANALKGWKPNETLNQWWSRKVAKGLQKGVTNIRRPLDFIEATGYEIPATTKGGKAGKAGAQETLFDRVSPAWQGVMPAIKKTADKHTFTLKSGNTKTGLGANNLFAVLWASGWTAKEVQEDLNVNGGAGVLEVAEKLAERGPKETLNHWFKSVYGAGAKGRPPPDKLLRDVESGRNQGDLGTESDEDAEAEQDRVNPVVLTLAGGIKVRRSDYENLRTKFGDLTLWYTGKPPENKDITRWTTEGTSNYQIALELSGRPGFFRSPAWKSQSETYKGVFRDMIGTDRGLPKQLIRKAIVHSWSAGDFAERLRQKPIYLKGNEFQSQTANLQNLYSEVQGGPITSGVKTALKEAALARWSDNQFTAWLRAQPEYGTSREQGRKVQNFNASMAAFFGQSLSRVTLPDPQPVTAFDLPDSDRIEGAGNINTDPVVEEVA